MQNSARIAAIATYKLEDGMPELGPGNWLPWSVCHGTMDRPFAPAIFEFNSAFANSTEIVSMIMSQSQQRKAKRDRTTCGTCPTADAAAACSQSTPHPVSLPLPLPRLLLIPPSSSNSIRQSPIVYRPHNDVISRSR